jgi:hypothetical protein
MTVAQFRRQCGEYPRDGPLGTTMVTTMVKGRGQDGCGDLGSCEAQYRNSVNVAMMIQLPMKISLSAALSAKAEHNP